MDIKAYMLSKGYTDEQIELFREKIEQIESSKNYLWIRYADSPTSGISDNPNGKKYIGIAYNKPVQEPSNNYEDYTWSLYKGVTYWLIKIPAIVRNKIGEYVPEYITVSAKMKAGDEEPTPYNGRFTVEETSNNINYVVKYTSAADESSFNYTPSPGIRALRIRLYYAGKTDNLLDEALIPIISEGATDFASLDGQILPVQLPDKIVDTSKLADNAVSAEKLKDYAVTSIKLAKGSVGEIHIESGSINEEKMKWSTHLLF